MFSHRSRIALLCVFIVLVTTLYLLNDAAYEWIKHVDSENVKHVAVGCDDKSDSLEDGINNILRGGANGTRENVKHEGGDEEKNVAQQNGTEGKEERNVGEAAAQREGAKRLVDNNNLPEDNEKGSAAGTTINTEGRSDAQSDMNKESMPVMNKDTVFKVEIKKHHIRLLNEPHQKCFIHDLPAPQSPSDEECNKPRVPNIVHIVWLYSASHNFTFRQFLSGLSMLQVQRPCAVLFWYDGYVPTGNYWQLFLVRHKFSVQ